jgi:hypothetical protein
MTINVFQYIFFLLSIHCALFTCTYLVQSNQPFTHGDPKVMLFSNLWMFHLWYPQWINASSFNPFILEKDACDFTLEVVFSQIIKDGFFHHKLVSILITFLLLKFNMKCMTRSSWQLLMHLRIGIIYLKGFKLSYIQIINVLNILWSCSCI